MLFERARRDPPVGPPLGLLEVFHTLEAIAETAGKGSRARKAELLEGMFKRASAVEAKYLVKVIYGEVRHGVNEGIMLDAIAKAAGHQGPPGAARQPVVGRPGRGGPGRPARRGQGPEQGRPAPLPPGQAHAGPDGGGHGRRL